MKLNMIKDNDEEEEGEDDDDVIQSLCVSCESESDQVIIENNSTEQNRTAHENIKKDGINQNTK